MKGGGSDCIFICFLQGVHILVLCQCVIDNMDAVNVDGSTFCFQASPMVFKKVGNCLSFTGYLIVCCGILYIPLVSGPLQFSVVTVGYFSRVSPPTSNILKPLEVAVMVLYQVGFLIQRCGQICLCNMQYSTLRCLQFAFLVSEGYHWR